MYDLIAIGGGPAGTAAAITAARQGARVLLLERGRFPRHKVCGEFVSAESLGLLSELLADSAGQQLLAAAPRIRQARLFVGGSTLKAAVDPAAVSIPRYDLDAALWRAAEELGVTCRQQVAVEAIEGAGPFTVSTATDKFAAQSVVNASGRWSKLSGALDPPHDKWVGLKGHFAVPHAAPSVDLYFSPNGYCGVQPISGTVVNACAMVRAGVAGSLEEVFALHPALREISRQWQPMMPEVATSPLVFQTPVCESRGVLHAGDAAGFVDPFVGDGISLALRSGTLAAQCLAGVWRSGISLELAAVRYRAAYQLEFLPIFQAAGRLRRLLGLPAPLRAPLLQLMRTRSVASFVIRKTRVSA